MKVAPPRGNICNDRSESVNSDNRNIIQGEIAAESSDPIMDEFESCHGSSFGAGERNEMHNSKNLESNSFWELIVNTHLPLALLWLKRGFFAITMIVRTLILGQLLRLVAGNISEWMNEEKPSWMVNFLQPLVGPQSRSEAKALPPPALIVLALLTVATMVVHPDGLTWVLLGKIK